MYDVIVIGGGHAGVEAALACARLNKKTLMVVGSIKRIGNMPCNPSIGGPAKGIIVREIDALGGEMAKATDATLLQLKMLNSSKGPAVRALRAQADKTTYPMYMRNVVFSTPNLEVLETYVTGLLSENNKVTGIEIEDGKKLASKAVIIASGTYLASRVLCGQDSKESGPDNERTTTKLSESLRSLGLELIRLKTGTPPRVKIDTINYDILTKQYGDDKKLAFSDDTLNPKPLKDQVVCYLTYTNENTHNIIRENLHLSSMYSGLIKGVGPRYCPSIEDKVVRFKDKDRHQIFIEPEGTNIDEMYIQGFSTSLPHYIQDKMIKTLPGLENAVITKYAYAIEYDAINPLELKNNLETKKISNLFFAGQVNGTSGYEEAAGQGLIAGINASLKLDNRPPLVLRRDEAYIGVLIDDLITKGVRDPYRMLTSRAEFRLLLRHDNSEARLLPYGYKVGLVNETRYQRFLYKQQLLNNLIDEVKEIKVNPTLAVNNYLTSNNLNVINEKVTGYDFLKRPDVKFSDLEYIVDKKFDIDPLYKDLILEEALINIKYEGYIQKEYKVAQKMAYMETRKIPDDIDYDKITNIASEAKDKLKKVMPATISQASRISGVNPSDIAVLLVYLESRNRHE